MLGTMGDKIIVANLYFDDRVDSGRVGFVGDQGVWVASTLGEDGRFIEIIGVENGVRDKLPLFVDSD